MKNLIFNISGRMKVSSLKYFKVKTSCDYVKYFTLITLFPRLNFGFEHQNTVVLNTPTSFKFEMTANIYNFK